MKRLLVLSLALTAALAGGAVRIVQDQCGPFTDVTPAFCPFVSELYYLGITAGTSPTTFSPDDLLTRGQAAVFIAKGLNQSLARSSLRAALGQWWTTQSPQALGLTAVGATPFRVVSDGRDLWVANNGDGTVTRVRGSDGTVLGTWTGAPSNDDVLVAMGRVFVIGEPVSNQTGLYMIDPTQPPGPMTLVGTANAGTGSPQGMAFDGSRVWTASSASVSIFTPGPSIPWAVISVSAGISLAGDMLWDGFSMWVADVNAGLLRLDQSGAVVQTVPIAGLTRYPVFDGANIWIPADAPATVSVVSASSGIVLATLTGNGMDSPSQAAFDGRRVLVTDPGAHAVLLWNAVDFAPLGSVSLLDDPFGACSDGVNFWITLQSDHLARF